MRRIKTQSRLGKEGAKSVANRKANQKLLRLVKTASWEEGQKFMSRIRIGKKSECWNWKAGKISTGYGAFCLNGVQVLSHRLSYVVFNGPILGSLEIHHKCENRGCCNPDHLQAVTHRENLILGPTFARVNSRKNYCPVGHPLSGENLVKAKPHRECRKCHNAAVLRRYYKKKANQCE